MYNSFYLVSPWTSTSTLNTCIQNTTEIICSVMYNDFFKQDKIHITLYTYQIGASKKIDT